MREEKLRLSDYKLLYEYGLEEISEEKCHIYTFEPGERVIMEGEKINKLYFVKEGKAKVVSTDREGKNLVLSYYYSGGIIGEVEYMTNAVYSVATIIAITKFTCIVINSEGQGLCNNIKLLNKIGQELAVKLLSSNTNFTQAILFTGEQRLCQYILKSSNNGVFNEILTDVAQTVGMSYRHLFRILNQLCEEGALEKRVCGYRIIDSSILKNRLKE